MDDTARIDAWLSGELDEAGRVELETWLRADIAHRRAFVRAARFSADLEALVANRVTRAEVGFPSGGFPIPPSSPVPASTCLPQRNQPSRRGKQRRTAAAQRPWASTAVVLLAACLCVTMGLLLWPKSPSLSPVPVTPPAPVMVHAPRDVRGQVLVEASLDASVSGQSITNGTALADGARVRVGAGGNARLRWPDRSVITLGAADATVTTEVTAAAAVLLHAGDLDADIAPQSGGRTFRIDTATARIDVIGTGFHVAAGAETRVEVISGIVRLTRRADARSENIRAGESADTAWPDLRRPPPIATVPVVAATTDAVGVTGLRLHFDAGYGVETAADGSVVRWSDRLGSSVAMPAVGAPAPQLAANIFFGRPAIAFLADDSVLASAIPAPLLDCPRGTIAAWVRLEHVIPGEAHGIFHIFDPDRGHPFEFGLQDGQAQIWTRTSDIGDGTFVRAACPTPTAWHHIAYVADGASLRFVIDGVEVAAQTENLTSHQAPFLGTSRSPLCLFHLGATREINQQPQVINNGESLSGWLADLRIWDVPLTTDVLRALAKPPTVIP